LARLFRQEKPLGWETERTNDGKSAPETQKASSVAGLSRVSANSRDWNRAVRASRHIRLDLA
jgi:hypothetical protein